MSNVMIITALIIALFILLAMSALAFLICDQLEINKKVLRIYKLLESNKQPSSGCYRCRYEFEVGPDRPCKSCSRMQIDRWEERIDD